MIIDKKGKLFGKVSIVDIAIVLFIVVIAVVLLWQPADVQGKKGSMQSVQCQYEGAVDGIRIESVNAIKSSIGKDVCDVHGTKLGTLISIEEKPYMAEIVTDSGEVILAEVPDKYSAKIVFEGECQKADNGCFISSAGYEISIGSKPVVLLEAVDVETLILNIKETE